MAEEDASLSVTSEQTVRVEWKLKDFFSLPREDDYYLESPSFIFTGAKWCIGMYPNGRTKHDCIGWISLYLRLKHCHSARRVIFTVGINKTNGESFICQDRNHLFKVEQRGFGCHKLIQRTTILDSIDDVAPDTVLRIFCSVRMNEALADNTVGVETVSQNQPPDDETLSQNFQELYVSECQADVVIRVKEKMFKAHRSILVARSPVFRSMFETDITENNNGTVNIDDCDQDSFKDFLLFLYSGKLDVVSSSNVLELYLTADKYDVKKLKRACSEYMIREISVNSVFDILSLAVLNDEQEVVNIASEFFINNAEIILTNSRWLSFLTEHLTLANKLLIKLAKKAKK